MRKTTGERIAVTAPLKPLCVSFGAKQGPDPAMTDGKTRRITAPWEGPGLIYLEEYGAVTERPKSNILVNQLTQQIVFRIFLTNRPYKPSGWNQQEIALLGRIFRGAVKARESAVWRGETVLLRGMGQRPAYSGALAASLRLLLNRAGEYGGTVRFSGISEEKIKRTLTGLLYGIRGNARTDFSSDVRKATRKKELLTPLAVRYADLLFRKTAVSEDVKKNIAERVRYDRIRRMCADRIAAFLAGIYRRLGGSAAYAAFSGSAGMAWNVRSAENIRREAGNAASASAGMTVPRNLLLLRSGRSPKEMTSVLLHRKFLSWENWTEKLRTLKRVGFKAFEPEESGGARFSVKKEAERTRGRDALLSSDPGGIFSEVSVRSDKPFGTAGNENALVLGTIPYLPERFSEFPTGGAEGNPGRGESFLSFLKIRTDIRKILRAHFRPILPMTAFKFLGSRQQTRKILPYHQNNLRENPRTNPMNTDSVGRIGYNLFSEISANRSEKPKNFSAEYKAALRSRIPFWEHSEGMSGSDGIFSVFGKSAEDAASGAYHKRNGASAGHVPAVGASVEYPPESASNADYGKGSAGNGADGKEISLSERILSVWNGKRFFHREIKSMTVSDTAAANTASVGEAFLSEAAAPSADKTDAFSGNRERAVKNLTSRPETAVNRNGGTAVPSVRGVNGISEERADVAFLPRGLSGNRLDSRTVEVLRRMIGQAYPVAAKLRGDPAAEPGAGPNPPEMICGEPGGADSDSIRTDLTGIAASERSVSHFHSLARIQADITVLRNPDGHFLQLVQNFSENGKGGLSAELVHAEKEVLRTVGNGERMTTAEIPFPGTGGEREDAGYARRLPPIEYRQSPSRGRTEPAFPQKPRVITRRQTQTGTPAITGSLENLSREEINRLADRIYAQIESRVLRERRRAGM